MQADNSMYDRDGDVWWDERSPLSCLATSLNPARVPYFLEVIDAQRDARSPAPKLLDVGCGGGLLSEEFATRGYDVTGVDPSGPSLATARLHAAQAGLNIEYREAYGESLPVEDAAFDVVACGDVLEHVRDVEQVIAEIARVLRPGGIFVFDTINRTFASRLLVIKLAQDWLRFAPRNFHVASAFIRPRELEAMLVRHGLKPGAFVGLRPGGNPLSVLAAAQRLRRGKTTYGEFGRRSKWVRSRSLAVSYMGYATRSGSNP